LEEADARPSLNQSIRGSSHPDGLKMDAETEGAKDLDLARGLPLRLTLVLVPQEAVLGVLLEGFENASLSI
jgi:hypothetical protein